MLDSGSSAIFELLDSRRQQLHYSNVRHLLNSNSNSNYFKNSRAGKYEFEQVEGKPAFYNIRMKLRIYNVSVADFGTYRCLAKNSQGETTGDIELYGNFYRHAI